MRKPELVKAVAKAATAPTYGTLAVLEALETIVEAEGHPLTVYDVSPEAVARMTRAGARAAASPREVGAASEVVVTMLPEPAHVEQAVLGPNGVAEG